MRRRLTQIRQYYAAREDAHAGGDIANAQRMGVLMWGLTLALAVALLPLSPPTDAIGGAGWIPTVAIVAAGVAVIWAMGGRRLPRWTALSAISYATVAAVAGLQWLAGGVDAPYENLLLLPVFFIAANNSPRSIAAFLFAVLAVLAAPLVYDRWDSQEAGSAGATFVIWCGLAVIVNVLMDGIRAQRLAHVREEAEARDEARLDTLTGLRNRRAFDEALHQAVERAQGRGEPLTLAMVDLENFKEVNDRWGYAAGDRCLREVASALRKAMREPDLLFRWGGDEFALILARTATTETSSLEERIGTAIARGCERPDEEPIRARIAAVQLADGMSAAGLIEAAGIALTTAKLEH